MTDKVYCSIGKPPKGIERGTQQECYDKGQVRYWGKKALDKNIIKNKPVKFEKLKVELMKKIFTNLGKIRKLGFDYGRQVNPDKKLLIKNEANALIQENTKLKIQVKEVENKIENDKSKSDKDINKLIRKADKQNKALKIALKKDIKNIDKFKKETKKVIIDNIVKLL